MDLALDALEWELHELVFKSSKDGSGSAAESFSGPSKNGEDGGWWGLEAIGTATKNAPDEGGRRGAVAAVDRRAGRLGSK